MYLFNIKIEEVFKVVLVDNLRLVEKAYQIFVKLTEFHDG